VSARTERRRQQRRKRTVVLAVAGGVAVVLAAAGAVVALSGGGDDTEHEAAVRGTTTTTTTTTTSTTTTTTTTTTAPPTTTSGPPDTSVLPQSTNPVVALAQQYDGRYEGTFTNTTFNTSGPVTLELRIDPATGDMGVQAHFDGDLFGGGASASRDIAATVKLGGAADAAITTQTDAFGPVTGHVDPTLALVLSAPDVPEPKVQTFDLTGRIKSDYTGFDATYTVGFEDGTTAEGTVSIVCSGGGQRSVDGQQTLCSPF
jgi:hypothetical protein